MKKSIRIFTAALVSVSLLFTAGCSCDIKITDEVTEAPSEPETTEQTTEEPSTVYYTEDPETPAETETTEAASETIPETPATEAEPVTYIRYCTATSLNVRTAASTDASIYTTIQKGAEVHVIGEGDVWAEIWLDGARYYVSREFLTDDLNKAQTITTKNGYENGALIGLNQGWAYANFSVINSGAAVMYVSDSPNRKNIIVGVNAGHGTSGGNNYKTYCHPDYTPKVTGGTTAQGATQAVAVSSGMTFNDGTPEYKVTLRMAQIFRDLLLSAGYDVLMIRDGDDVQLDNVARTVICNNVADCHIAIHWDGDGLAYDKGCFCMTVPDGIKYMQPVASIWQEDDRLGVSLVQGLQSQGVPIHGSGTAQLDLTQTSFSSIPSIDIELGNQCSTHTEEELWARGYGMLAGVNIFFNQN